MRLRRAIALRCASSPLAGSKPSISESAGNQFCVLSGLGVLAEVTRRCGINEASNVHPQDRRHLQPVSLRVRTKSLCGHWCAMEPNASAFVDDSRKEHAWLVIRTIRPASRCNLQRFARERNAKRDYVLIKGSYLLGCRVSEMAAIRWKDIEPLDGGGQIHLVGKGSKSRAVRISNVSLALFEQLGRGEASGFFFSSPRTGSTSQGKLSEMCVESGDESPVPRSPTPDEA